MLINNLFFKIGFLFFLISVSVVLSGCSITGKADGGVYKSEDGGGVFSQKVFISDKSTIGRENIMDIEIDTDQPNVVYIGTERLGLLRSVDGGASWVKDTNNFTNVMSIEKVPQSQTIFVAVKLGNRGKVFKTMDGGNNWNEIYTEKSEEGMILSIAFDYNNPEVVYIGSSSGGIFKTEDGGLTWKTLLWAKSGISKIAIDRADSSVVYFGTTKSGALITKNGGKDFVEIRNNGSIFNLVVHPNKGGVVYVSTNEGLVKSDNYGESWEVLNTLVKPKEIESKGLAINPSNSNEIFYTAGKAFYKSVDSGATWKPVQFNISRIIREIEIDPNNSNVIYVGTDAGGSSFKLFPE